MDITLALGGGGAKGNSHIGVLRRLEKEGYRIRSVAGTSYGGLVAVLYAVGHSPQEIQIAFEEVDQKQLYSRDVLDGPSLLGLGGVRKLLDQMLGEKTFDDLRIPCAVTAVDINAGSEVVITSGLLKDALLATIALPGIFPIQRMNDWDLTDGGVLNPVPVSVARMLSPGLPVVAVVLNDPMDRPVRSYTLPMPSIFPRPLVERLTRISLAQSLDIFLRSVDISSRALSHYRLELEKPEVIVRPNVHDFGLLDKVVITDLVQLGEQAVEEVLPQLKKAVSWQARLGKKIFGANR